MADDDFRDRQLPDEADARSLDGFEESLGLDTSRDQIEFLGEYESVEEYLQSMLGELMHPEITWILEHVNYMAVLERFEADGSRYFHKSGAVYRTG